jgi:hypothetical protein
MKQRMDDAMDAKVLQEGTVVVCLTTLHSLSLAYDASKHSTVKGGMKGPWRSRFPRPGVMAKGDGYVAVRRGPSHMDGQRSQLTCASRLLLVQVVEGRGACDGLSEVHLRLTHLAVHLGCKEYPMASNVANMYT